MTKTKNNNTNNNREVGKRQNFVNISNPVNLNH